MQPTPASLPGKFPGQINLAGSIGWQRVGQDGLPEHARTHVYSKGAKRADLEILTIVKSLCSYVW